MEALWGYTEGLGGQGASRVCGEVAGVWEGLAGSGGLAEGP